MRLELLKAFRFFVLFFLVFTTKVNAQEDFRTWSDSNGKYSIEAVFVELDEETVHLRKKDGKAIKIAVEKLSKADQEFVRKVASLSKRDPLESVVRIPFTSAIKSGTKVSSQLICCAIATDEPNPIVIGALGSIKYSFNILDLSKSLEGATIRSLLSPKKLGVCKNLVDLQSGDSKSLVLVLRTSDDTNIPDLQLASKPASIGDQVLVPILPRPNSSKRSSKPTKIKWARWIVKEHWGSQAILLDTQGGDLPSTGALPVLNLENQVVALYFNRLVLKDESSVGMALQLDTLKAALKESRVAMPFSPATKESAPPSELSLTIPPLVQTPVDKHAPWRSSFHELHKNISVTKGANGQWEIDWGDAADMGVWYERCRIAMKRARMAMYPNKRTPKTRGEVQSIFKEVKAAHSRLEGIEWTARVAVSGGKPGRSVKLELPALPKPLRASFWIDDEEGEKWAKIRRGSQIRFSCRFVVNALADYPDIRVNMTLLEVIPAN